MKQFIILSLFTLSTLLSMAQITITSSDIGNADDTARYSYAVPVNNAYMDDGANQTWDLTNLTATSQYLDGYIALNDVSLVYKIAFFNNANLVSPRDNMSLMGISITDSYTFFDKNSNDFRIVGSGGKANGSMVPLVYDNADILYRFPMNYGNLDSSDSHFSMNMASMGYIEQDLHRVNKVDAWGTLITPHDSYQCLRIKSSVFQNDSVYFTSTSQGMRLPQYYTEYIWMAKGMDFPVAVAKVSNNNSYITYMDDYIPFASIDNSKQEKLSINIYPNPSSDFIKVSSSSKSGNRYLSIININGKVVCFEPYTQQQINIDVRKWASGLYYVIITDENGQNKSKFIVK